MTTPAIEPGISIVQITFSTTELSASYLAYRRSFVNATATKFDFKIFSANIYISKYEIFNQNHQQYLEALVGSPTIVDDILNVRNIIY